MKTIVMESKKMNAMVKSLLIALFALSISVHGLAEAEMRHISAEEVILSAHNVMTEVYSYDESIVNSFHYDVEEKHNELEVRVYPFTETNDCFILTYKKDGTLQSCSVPDILDLSAFDKLVYEKHKTFSMYTLEEKAAYSEEYIPKVEAILRLNPNYDGLHYDYTRSRYGLPEDDDLTQELALEIAKQAAIDLLGLDADWFDDHFWHQTFFDITDPDCTLWKFYFGNTRPGKGKYVIRLNSKTGEVVKAFEYTGNMPLWEAL